MDKSCKELYIDILNIIKTKDSKIKLDEIKSILKIEERYEISRKISYKKQIDPICLAKKKSQTKENGEYKYSRCKFKKKKGSLYCGIHSRKISEKLLKKLEQQGRSNLVFQHEIYGNYENRLLQKIKKETIKSKIIIIKRKKSSTNLSESSKNLSESSDDNIEEYDIIKNQKYGEVYKYISGELFNKNKQTGLLDYIGKLENNGQINYI